MTRHLFCTYAAVLLLAGSASAQQKATITGVPEIPFTPVASFLKLPPGESLGESVGVATNSKGHIFVYHRRDTTRLFEFDKTGTFKYGKVMDSPLILLEPAEVLAAVKAANL